jgi:hypothetical protein
MEGKSAKPANRVKVNVDTIGGGMNIKVNKTAAIAPKANALPTDTKPKTVADYIPPLMDDPRVDKAIDDMIVSESNEVLAAEDSMYDSSNVVRPKKKKRQGLKKILRSKWLYIGLGVVIVGIFILPYSRYLILGQFIKNNCQITLTDSVTKLPVSGAEVVIDNDRLSTNASGQAMFKLPLGKHKYIIRKQFYAESSGYVFIGLVKSKLDNISLNATGRQVPITVINKLSGRRLEGVKISVLNTSAITNSVGQTNIVLPTKHSSYEATFKANSFDTATEPIEVTTSTKTNIISLIPAGSIYYLSNATGTINVIKANLDGSNPTIELAGTGNETAATTILMASPDWNYLVLEAKRSGSQPELYVINTSSGNLDEFDSAADNFTLIGWSNDQFIYDEVNPSSDPSTVGREEIKSYNALNGQLNVLDENQVVGSSPSYAYQSFGDFELLSNKVVYTTTWTSVNSYDLSSSNDTIRSVESNGEDKRDYSSFNASTTGQISFNRYQPSALYISVPNTSTNQTSYYSYTNGAVNPSNINVATFSAKSPTYYLSPSAEDSLWINTQNGQQSIMIGNSSGQNGQKINIPAGYTPSGWYDNIYILLTEDGQLYIAPVSASKAPTLIGSYLAAAASS